MIEDLRGRFGDRGVLLGFGIFLSMIISILVGLMIGQAIGAVAWWLVPVIVFLVLLVLTLSVFGPLPGFMDVASGSKEHEVRGVLLQALAGVALVATFLIGYMQLAEARTQAAAARDEVEVARDQLAKQTQLTIQSQIADRFSRAVSDLGEETTEAKIGGIVQLERIASEELTASEEERKMLGEGLKIVAEFREPAVQVIAAFARSASRVDPNKLDSPATPPAYGYPPGQFPPLDPPVEKRLPEIKAALDSLGRINKLQQERGGGSINVDLRRVDMIGAHLPNINLAGARLDGASMQGADLSEADLQNASLKGADIRGADLTGAKLQGVDCSGAIVDKRTRGRDGLHCQDVVAAEIEIGQLGQDAAASGRVTVEGPFQALAPYRILLAVVPVFADEPRYYPHPDVHEIDSESLSWDFSGVFVGQPGEQGREFAIAVILVDRNAWAVFAKYRSRGEFSGIERLPQGAIELDRKEVTRP